MSDLKEELEKLFRDAFNSDSKVRELYGKIRQGNATHKDALRFAERVGQLAARTFRENTSEEMFGSAEMRKEMVDSIMGLLRLDHEIVTEVTTIVQENLNKQAGIGLKAVEPKMDLERAQGLSQYVAEQENRDKAAAKMDSGAVNFSQHTVDEHLKQNARFQWKAGMSPKILRTAEAGACKWCKALAGVYDYGDVKDTGNDVFRRHENCNCVVEYIADGKKAQDVWSKATYRRDDPEDRVTTIKKLEEAWKKRQEDQLKQRAARAEAVSKIQSELGYSAKQASIWYNQNKGYIERYGLDYVIDASLNRDGLTLNSSGSTGTKLPSLSSRGVAIPEKLTDILEKTPEVGNYCVVDELSNNELRTLTQETGVEFAKVTISEDIYVIRGEERGIVIPESFVDEMRKRNGRLDAHCHPFIGDVIPSKADLKTISILEKETGQNTSEIISVDGMRSIYSKYGIISVETVTDNSTLSEERKNAFLRLFGGE